MKTQTALLLGLLALVGAGLTGCNSQASVPSDYAANFKPKPIPPGQMAQEMQAYAAHVAAVRKKMGLPPGPSMPGVPAQTAANSQ